MNMVDSRETLLKEVLSDHDTGAHEAGKQAALTAFRRRRTVRRATNVTVGVIVAVVICAATVHFASLPEDKGANVVRQSVPAAVPAAIPEQTPPSLTDEELVASFPPNTCFVAEVNGRKVLIFADAAARRKYLTGQM
jgi:hypothetical protein